VRFPRPGFGPGWNTDPADPVYSPFARR
jgi:hypothetical protein